MRRRHLSWIALAIGFAASLVVCFAWAWGWLKRLEDVAMDLEMLVRGPDRPSPEVVLVAIDGPSIDAFGRWPWPRSCLARLIDRLAAGEPRVIVLDILFSEPSRSPAGAGGAGGESAEGGASEDRALAEALRRADNVVLGYFFRPQPPEAAPEASTPCPECDLPAAARGSKDLRGWNVEAVGGPFRVPSFPDVEPNLDELTDVALAQGFFSSGREAGAQRHYDLVAAYPRGPEAAYYPSLALAAVAEQERAAGDGGQVVRLVPEPPEPRWIALLAGIFAKLLPQRPGLAGHPGPTGPSGPSGTPPQILLRGHPVAADEQGRLWVNYRGPAGTFPTLSAARVLRDPAAVADLRDRLVFVGITEEAVGDFVATPFDSRLPGLEVHANVADNLLTGDYIEDTDRQLVLSLLALFLFGPLVAGLVTAVDRHWLGSLLGFAAVVAWPVACYRAFLAGSHLYAVAPVAAGGVALVATLGFQVFFVEQRGRKLSKALKHYVSPRVAERIEREPDIAKLDGELRDMTVLFSDIRGFTATSERLGSPENVVALLKEYFTPMSRRVLEQEGTLDKFMGDGLMAFFGAPVEPPELQPHHAARACASALAMLDELDALNRRWRAAGRFPQLAAPIAIGIGLSSGEMNAGNMGASELLNYTVIGDPVNLGQRIEALNKEYGTRILVSAATAEAAGDGFLFREVDRVIAKGQKARITVCELLSRRPAEPALVELAAAFARGLAAYRGRDFATAEETFVRILAERGDDGPSRCFLERARAFRREPPPPDWDGVHRQTEK